MGGMRAEGTRRSGGRSREVEVAGEGAHGEEHQVGHAEQVQHLVPQLLPLHRRGVRAHRALHRGSNARPPAARGSTCAPVSTDGWAWFGPGVTRAQKWGRGGVWGGI